MTTAVVNFFVTIAIAGVHDELCFYHWYHIEKALHIGEFIRREEENLNLMISTLRILNHKILCNARHTNTIDAMIKKELFTLFFIEIDKNESKNMNLWWEWDERQCSFNNSRKRLKRIDFFMLSRTLYNVFHDGDDKNQNLDVGKIFFRKTFLSRNGIWILITIQ